MASKRQWFLKWTDGGPLPVKTKKRGLELMKEWRTSKEAEGWRCYSTDKGTAVIALPPTWRDFPSGPTRHAITLREVVHQQETS